MACDMTAIAPADRSAHHQLTRELVAEAAIRESADGFLFDLPLEAFDRVARFVSRERLCCPFLDFRIETRADQQSVRLALGGPEGAKAFIRAELNLP
jgi:hypothetical protein